MSIEAKVCLHSWSVMRCRPASVHAAVARAASFPDMTETCTTRARDAEPCRSAESKDAPEGVGERNSATGTGFALGLLNRQPLLAELDVLPAQALDFLPPEPRVEGDRVRNRVVRTNRGEQPF